MLFPRSHVRQSRLHTNIINMVKGICDKTKPFYTHISPPSNHVCRQVRRVQEIAQWQQWVAQWISIPHGEGYTMLTVYNWWRLNTTCHCFGKSHDVCRYVYPITHVKDHQLLVVRIGSHNGNRSLSTLHMLHRGINDNSTNQIHSLGN